MRLEELPLDERTVMLGLHKSLQDRPFEKDWTAVQVGHLAGMPAVEAESALMQLESRGYVKLRRHKVRGKGPWKNAIQEDSCITGEGLRLLKGEDVEKRPAINVGQNYGQIIGSNYGGTITFTMDMGMAVSMLDLVAQTQARNAELAEAIQELSQAVKDGKPKASLVDRAVKVATLLKAASDLYQLPFVKDAIVPFLDQITVR
jgi:hypothetical protein